MHKYLALFSTSWQNGFTYRASVFLWRFRQFLSSFFSLTIWTVLYQNSTNAFGYTAPQMISYIFLSSIIQNVVITTSLNGLTSTIYSGELSLLLIKPINIFKALATQEVADKAKNFIFVILESCLLFLLFHPELLPIALFESLLAVFWIFGGILLNYFVSLIFGAIGFWSPESWGPRFLFFTLMNFIGGKYFPLDILPKVVQQIIWLTPFPFLSYAQVQLLLNRLTQIEIVIGSIGLLLWLTVLGLLTKYVWKIGLKNYAAMGH